MYFLLSDFSCILGQSGKSEKKKFKLSLLVIKNSYLGGKGIFQVSHAWVKASIYIYICDETASLYPV